MRCTVGHFERVHNYPADITENHMIKLCLLITACLKRKQVISAIYFLLIPYEEKVLFYVCVRVDIYTRDRTEPAVIQYNSKLVNIRF